MQVSRLGMTKYCNAASKQVVDIFAGTNHRGLFVLKERLAF